MTSKTSRGFSSDPRKRMCYRVWALGYAVLVDADSEEEARKIAAPMLDCTDADIDTVDLLVSD